MRYCMFILLLILLAHTLPVCAAEKPAYLLPMGDQVIPLSALTKLQVKRQGDVFIVLTLGKRQVRLLLDTTYYESNGGDFGPASQPTFAYDGDVYLSADTLEALGINTKLTKASITLTAGTGKAKTAITCPLRAMPPPVKTPGIHPIVDFIGGGGWLVGGLQQGVWCSAERLQPVMKHKESYRIYTLKGFAETTMADPPREEEQGYGYTVDKATGKDGIGIACSWNAMPRVPKVQDTKQAGYIRAFEEIAAAHGIKNPSVTIQQLLRVDLDGDGKEEVLSTVTDTGDQEAMPEAGSFRFVAVRKLINGNVQTVLLLAGFAPQQLKHAMLSSKYEITGTLDVDGDGQEEIIIRELFYMNATNVYVFKYANGRYWNVLLGGWGD